MKIRQFLEIDIKDDLAIWLNPYDLALRLWSNERARLEGWHIPQYVLLITNDLLPTRWCHYLNTFRLGQQYS